MPKGVYKRKIGALKGKVGIYERTKKRGGWKLSEITRKRMKESSRHTSSCGMRGKKHNTETIEKMSKAHKGKLSYMFGKTGALSPNWRGGKSFEPYSLDWTRTLRQSIRERDKYTCQICGEKQGDRALSVHHIDYNKENCNPNNLISVCIRCHVKTNYNRDYWLKLLRKTF